MASPHPDILYHYTGPSAAKGVISALEVWASKIQFLNDDKEYIQYLDFFKKAAARQFDDGQADSRSFIDELNGVIESLLRANIFVASFTERGDLLSQWRGYCPSGGYAIGFSRNYLESCFHSQGLRFVEARYSLPGDSSIAEVLERSFRRYREVYVRGDDGRLPVAFVEITDHLIAVAPSYKHAGFAEEREWRLYSSLIEWTDSRVDVVDIRGRLRPILRVSLKTVADGDVELSPKFESIVVSPGPDHNLRREALVILLRRLGADYGKVVHSLIPYNSR